MVNALQAGAGGRGGCGQLEVHCPEGVHLLLGFDQVQQASIQTAQGRDLVLAGAGWAVEDGGLVGLGPLQHLLHPLDQNRHRADRGAVHLVVGLGKAARLAVENEINLPLLPQAYLLGAVLAALLEAQGLEELGQGGGHLLADGELHEGHPAGLDGELFQRVFLQVDQ